ncbi:MAG TPA: sialidase family protein, partial [Polyangiaceae bacterium]|nr:sialidase family protein [Polyangiaceae bacterium]
LVSCYQELGLGSAEPTLAVTRDGTVTYAPVFTNQGVGLHQSRDHGKTWTTIIPKFPDNGSHGRMQPYLWRDPETDRMFLTTTTLGFTGGDTSPSTATAGYDMTRTSDNWKTYTYSNVALETSDWLKMYAGPPVTSQTQGYPNVIYISAPSPISTILGEYQAVYKSLDGGASWQQVGGKQLSLRIADHPNCAPENWVIYGNGGVGPDGSVYISLHRCGRLAVAISRDEGNTWSMVEVPGTALLKYQGLLQMIGRANALLTEPLAIDSEGNIYLVWPDEPGLLRLSISRDKGQTWSAPVVISAPSVKYAVYGGVAIRKPGTLAIAYYGSELGQPGPFDGYIAETTDALAAEPSFVSARVNDPAKPLSPVQFDVGYARLFSGGDLHEIVKPEYAPNGDIWASFARDMCPGLGAELENCGWDVTANTNSFYQAAVGRLVHR